MLSHRLASPLLLLGLLVLLLPTTARAVDFEVYGFAGLGDELDVRFGTGIACIAIAPIDCPVSASAEDDGEDTWGLGAALRISGPWWLDVRWFEQEAAVRFFDFGDLEITFVPIDFEVTHLQAGTLYRFREDRWSPFATAFAGVALVESPISTHERSSIDLERGTVGLGAGVLADLGDHLGLRVEVRSSWTSLPDEFDGDLDRLEGTAALRLRL